MRPLILLLALSTLSAQELFTNGGFEERRDGWPVALQGQRSLGEIVEEDGNAFLRLSRTATFTRSVPLQDDWRSLRLSLRMRLHDVRPGAEAWHDARVVMSWHDADGERVGDWPGVIHGSGDAAWTEHVREYAIPAGATSLRLGPAFFAEGGHADFDDLSLTVATRDAPLEDSPRPAGAPDTDDLAAAWRDASASRASVCLNGLWRFQPVLGEAGEAPPRTGSGWSWFKVPGIWPRVYRSWQPDINASLMAPNAGLEQRLDWASLDQAWYSRRLVCPPRGEGQRTMLRFAMVQTHARIYVDGVEAGQQQWPGGSVDLSAHLTPGRAHEIAILITARPLQLRSTIEMGPGRSFATEGSVTLRGITGDVFLDTVGDGPRLSRVQFEPDTANDAITLRAAVGGKGDWRIGLAIEDADDLPPAAATPGDDGRLQVTLPWPDARRWDLHDRHLYAVRAQLYDGDRLVDETLSTRIGFRDFRIEGRDFILNGSRVALRALSSRNITGMADLASEAGCRRTMRAAKALGFNALITSNYHFKPGAVGEMDAFYRIADEEGILIACSLPHAGDFGWQLEDPVIGQRYRDQAAWIIDRVGHHPSIVLYTMNHNATGYGGDQNPLAMDGSFVPERDAPEKDWSRRVAAGTAEAIAKAIDPTRPVYHHQSGPLGDVYSLNCYLNWSPIQERCDWLETWAQGGSSTPMFFVEWGLPHIASWSSYRGPAFIWRTEAPQAVWDSEFAAALMGERAYRYDEPKREQVAHEEWFYREGRPIHYGHLVQPILNGGAHTYLDVQAEYIDRTWPALRGHGISAILPWDQRNLWRATGVADQSIDNPDRWVGLQAPGIVPDRLHPHRSPLGAYDPAAFTPSTTGAAMARWNQPVIAMIVGHEAHPTEAGHIFAPGEAVAKQVRVINEGRVPVEATYRWSLMGTELSGQGTLAADVGRHAAAPITFEAPAPGSYRLELAVTIGDQVQTHGLDIEVLAPRPAPAPGGRIAVLDPEGDTAAWLTADGIPFDLIDADAELDGYALLIIGRRALGVDGAIPNIERVADGLQVLIAAQRGEVLAQRFGFRVTEHGFRRLFAREADHPLLAGIADAHLRDWRGQASMLPPFVDGALTAYPRYEWAGFDNARVWRAGTWGTVCQVAIEEPTTGPYRSLIDGGFDLQYSALLEHRLGAGRIVFCQLDLEARGDREPAATQLRRNLIAELSTPLPAAPTRSLRYLGDAAQRQLLIDLGADVQAYAGEPIGPDQLLVIGGSFDAPVTLTAGGAVIALGLDEAALRRLLGDAAITTDRRLPDLVELPAHPALRGISAAERHWRSELTVADTDGAGSAALRLHHVDGADAFVVPAPPSRFEAIDGMYVRTSIRRSTALVAQLLRNHGVALASPLLEHAGEPATRHRIDLSEGWVGLVDREDVGRDQGWDQPAHDASAWQPIAVPGMFDQLIPELKGYDGTFWYRLDFPTPALLPQGQLELVLGAIDDESWVWLNGEFLGEVTKATNPKDYWAAERRYALDPDRLRTDGQTNSLIIRVVDGYKSGGIRGTPHLIGEARWLRSSYRQVPVAEDDPYRYYRW